MADVPKAVRDEWDAALDSYSRGLFSALEHHFGIAEKAGTISQHEADYTEDGPIEAERCRHCTMFRAPDSCTYVEGDIHPGGHCRFFNAR